MRIAVSGTHAVGKTTLIEELAARLLDRSVVEEPYYLLEEDGYEFSVPPTLDEFRLQLRRSIACLATRRRNVLFDRCPLDFLGYLAALPDTSYFDPEPWLPAIEQAIRGLDLLVYIPIIPELDAILFGVEDDGLRVATDDQLRELILDDRLDLCGGIDVMELAGPLSGRADRVLEHLSRR